MKVHTPVNYIWQDVSSGEFSADQVASSRDIGTIYEAVYHIAAPHSLLSDFDFLAMILRKVWSPAEEYCINKYGGGLSEDYGVVLDKGPPRHFRCIKKKITAMSFVACYNMEYDRFITRNGYPDLPAMKSILNNMWFKSLLEDEEEEKPFLSSETINEAWYLFDMVYKVTNNRSLGIEHAFETFSKRGDKEIANKVKTFLSRSHVGLDARVGVPKYTKPSRTE